MTTYDPTSGSIVHVEYYSDDVEATQSFYERVFDWTFETDEDLEYTMWRSATPPFGAVMPREDGPFSPPPTIWYIQVDDIETIGTAIEAAGGEILQAAMEVPEMGVFTIFREPGGAIEAVWEDRFEGEPPAEGWPEFTDEPAHGSIAHFELYSEDPQATTSFHETVFDWTFEPMDDDEYTVIRPPTPPFGGLMAATDELPTGTLTYLVVSDVEATVDAIETAGGTVLREPFEIEGWGTMTVFETPGGVVQAAWESAMAEQATGRPESEPTL